MVFSVMDYDSSYSWIGFHNAFFGYVGSVDFDCSLQVVLFIMIIIEIHYRAVCACKTNITVTGCRSSCSWLGFFFVFFCFFSLFLSIYIKFRALQGIWC